MSIAVDKNSSKDAAPVETLYTICPVLTAANVVLGVG